MYGLLPERIGCGWWSCCTINAVQEKLNRHWLLVISVWQSWDLVQDHSCRQINLLLRDRRVSRYPICQLFITIRRSWTCCLKCVEDLTRNRINVSSTINTICLSRVCVALFVVRVSMRTCSWVLSLRMTFFLSNGTACAFEPFWENYLHPPGHVAADAGPPVLRSTVDAVTSMRSCLCAKERNSRMFVGTLFALISDTTCFG